MYGGLKFATAAAEAEQRRREQELVARREAAFEANPGQTYRTGLGSYARIPFAHPPPESPSPADSGEPQGAGGSDAEREAEKLIKEAMAQQQALDFANYFFEPTEESASQAAPLFRRPEDNAQGYGTVYLPQERAHEAFKGKPEGGWPSFGDLPPEVQKSLFESAMAGELPIVQRVGPGGSP